MPLPPLAWAKFRPQIVAGPLVYFVAIQVDKRLDRRAVCAVVAFAVAVDIQERLAGFQRIIDHAVAVVVFAIAKRPVEVHPSDRR